ncbi:hypothetical protein JHK85_018521 [Glycine max]|nr:hypothetical protein JHK85_018521 [Glycine max]
MAGGNEDNKGAEAIIKKKRKKASTVWNDFDEVEIPRVGKKVVCRYCKDKLSMGSKGGKGGSTSHLRRHSKILGIRYSNERMREIIVIAVMVHELPFNIVKDEVWMWAFQYANSKFQKISRKTLRNDCLALYEVEKKQLKTLLKTKFSHQVVEYMVITGHFMNAGWNLQKKVLSFVKVPTPQRGIDVADAIFKCLKARGIEDKVFSVCVDNASYNDSCLKNLKENLSLSRKLILNGDLFHVRCCAHILNLLVQDGLSKIKDIIQNVRKSVKYINHNDSRLKVFCDVVEQKHLKERKLIIDCPTRWNSTFQMLSTILKFKTAFSAYNERDPHYTYAPSHEDWEKVQKVCTLLEVFNIATHIISSSEYPTANLYLAEVWRVKQVIDNALEDTTFFMREMAGSMKVKFDKYWGECNMLMSIASVLDPRCKFHVVNICFPLIYKSEEIAKENIEKYVTLSINESSLNEMNDTGINSSTTSASKSSIVTGFDQIMNIVRANEAIPPMKSELEDYLKENVYIPETSNSSFSVLEWWRNNSLKYKVLSKMAGDILIIPISIVASESTFSIRGRVIDE